MKGVLCFLARLQNITPIRSSDDAAKKYVLRLRAFCINYIHQGQPVTLALLRYLYGRSLWTWFIAAELLRYCAITLLRTLFVDFVYRGRTVTQLRYYGHSLRTLFIMADLLRYYAITDALCGLCLSRANCYAITLLRTLFVDFVYRGRTVTQLRYYGHSLRTLFIMADLLRYYAITDALCGLCLSRANCYAITDALCGLCLSRPNCYAITLLHYYGRSLWTLFIAAELIYHSCWGEGGRYLGWENEVGGGEAGKVREGGSKEKMAETGRQEHAITKT